MQPPPTYTEPIRRIDGQFKGKPTHKYIDAHGHMLPGVTTILNKGYGKGDVLINWAANATVDRAMDDWDRLAKLPLSKRRAALTGAHWDIRDAAANRGTEVHAFGEKLIKGESVEVPNELAPYVDSYVAFLDIFKPRAQLVEASVYNLDFGYGGTFDWYGFFPEVIRLGNWTSPPPDEPCLVDIKTSGKGVYDETGQQLAAYRYATYYFTKSNTTPRPMLPVHRTLAVWVRSDGFDVEEVATTGDEWRQFQRSLGTYWYKRERADEVIGPKWPQPIREEMSV